jgi:hypothetical protein
MLDVPLGDARLCRSIPDTWVTVHSGHIGNTFGPNGFSIGSRRQPDMLACSDVLKPATGSAMRGLGAGVRKGGNVRKNRVLIALVVITAGTWSESARAQGYLTGGIHFPKQDAAPPPTSPYVVAPSGQTTGWFAGGGVYLIPAIAVDVAWARTGVMSSVQTPRFNQTVALDLRDNFILLGARARIPAGPHFTVEPVGGFVILLRENWSQQAGGFPRRKNVAKGYGLSFGVDARIGSPQVGVVPTLRIYVTNRNVNASEYPGGAERVTIAPGIGMQVNF